MRAAFPAAILAALATGLSAQDATIAAPKGALAQYDPTLSAKEAVLANWDMAASGIRAGAVLGGRVAAMAEKDVPYARLARMAAQAEATMVQRWNAAQWVYAGAAGLPAPDGGVLQAAVRAAATPCAEGPCTAETAALRRAFAAAAAEMDAAAAAARGAVEARASRGDAALMAEQLGAVAGYLSQGAWAEGLMLAAEGRDREEVAARLVGAMAIWRNVEPYVGLTDPALDAEINAAAEALLRTLRLGERQPGPLTAEGPEIAALRARAEVLADAFRRAAGLFAA